MSEENDLLALYPDVEAALRRYEAEGQRAGWNSDLAFPDLFTLTENERDGRLRCQTLEMLTQAVRDLSCDGAMGVGEAVGRIGWAAEEAAQAFGGVPTFDKPGWRVRGVGLRAEAWVLQEKDDETRRAAEEHQIHVHPDRRESRFVSVVTREGVHWYCYRMRGHGDVQEIKAWPCGSTDQFAGTVVKGLTRLTAVLTETEIPMPVGREGRS